MWKPKFGLNKISLVFLSLVVLGCLWNMSVFFIPSLIVTGIVVMAIIYNCRHTVSISTSLITFILLFLYEVFNFYFSAYRPNSILFLRDFFIVLCCIVTVDKVLLDIKYIKYKIYFVVFISGFAGVLALFNILFFFFKYYEMQIYGFEDFSQFRFLYAPFGFVSNEWVTVLLCLLPFPVIGWFLGSDLTYLRNPFKFLAIPTIRYVFLLIAGLLLFNIFMSFSRAGILAFILFAVILTLLFYFNHVVSVKKIIISNLVIFILISLFAFSFSSSIQSSIRQTNSHQRSTEGRLKQWKQTLNVINKHSFWGIGSKNYALFGSQTQSIDLENTFSGRVNNSYIQLVIEKGLTGLLLWLCAVGMFIFHFFKQIKKETKRVDKAISSIILSAIIAILFREFFFSSLFYNSGILLLFFILLLFGKNAVISITVKKQTVVVFIALFTIGTVYSSYINRDENALIYATRGLEFGRQIKNDTIYNDTINKFATVECKNNDCKTIKEAIRFYRKACQICPFDALFQHNLGWLYQMNRQPDSAMICLSQAIKLDINNALYYISMGLLLENKCPSQAFDVYQQAILLSPDIVDSRFFKYLQKIYPIETENLLKNIYDILESAQYSSVIEAKKGKIALSLGNSRAYDILNHVVQVHPNLSRPWYYLGWIEQRKGNFDAMKGYYKKSLFLMPYDHLPQYALASYYKSTGEKRKANSYYKTAERAWKNKRSVHSARSKRLYYRDTERDDVLPCGLLDYITPVFQIITLEN
jgi:O-antigen ligase/tetratricopeptide (TPR) repeat protein